MNVRYLFNGLSVSEDVIGYIEKKIKKVEKMLDTIMGVEIEIGLNKKGMYRVEIMVKIPKKLYRAEEISESIESSTDAVIGELQTQIRRSKEKTKDIRKRGARSIKKKIVLDDRARF